MGQVIFFGVCVSVVCWYAFCLLLCASCVLLSLVRVVSVLCVRRASVVCAGSRAGCAPLPKKMRASNNPNPFAKTDWNLRAVNNSNNSKSLAPWGVVNFKRTLAHSLGMLFPPDTGDQSYCELNAEMRWHTSAWKHDAFPGIACYCVPHVGKQMNS